jgi:glycosyltransferase involved in cell wall biosynthesis
MNMKKIYSSYFQTVKDTFLAYIWLGRQIFHPESKNIISSKDKRFLLLVWEFAPAIAGGVYRPAALARYASQSGWAVTVIASEAQGAPVAAGRALLDYVGSDVQIERFNNSNLVPSVRLFPQIDGGLLTALEMANLVQRRFGANIPRVIVASGPPFSSFVAGYFLSRNPLRKLVLEYRDEWSECPFDFVSKTNSDTRWEARCLARANQIIVTTESQKAQLIKKFGTKVGVKCRVVPNGWEPSANISEEFYIPNAYSTRVVLTFAGKLGGHTDPSNFLLTLTRLLHRRPDLLDLLLIRFVGSKTPSVVQALAEFPYQQVIELLPVVPLGVATKLMSDSDALLLFHDMRFRRYLPGKLYEYAASGTPVLLIDDDGESDRLVQEFDIGWSVRSDNDVDFESVISSLLATKKQSFGKQSLKNPKFKSWLESHTREALAGRVLEMISNGR